MRYTTTAERLGRAEERRDIVLDQLAYKCGPLEDALRAQVEALGPDQLLTLTRALLDFSGEADLRVWLDQQVADRWSAPGKRYVTTAERIGRIEGRRELVLHQLAHTCGPLDESLWGQVAALTPEQLLTLSDALLDFTGEANLRSWLAQHATP